MGALPQHGPFERGFSMRSIALWLLGVPIPLIILLWFFMR
ncbi:hypothetical protein J2Y55_005662 [Bosea sp. BE125]|nr:hypothetical protein [Bosea sp. BE125]